MEQQQQQQPSQQGRHPSWLTSSSSSAATSRSSPVLRSSPIAIVRQVEHTGRRPTTRGVEDRVEDSDDEYDDDNEQDESSTNELEEAVLNLSQLTVGSLPTKPQRSGWSERRRQVQNNNTNLAQSMPTTTTRVTPRAPLLTSRHDRDEQEKVQIMPTMTLTEQAAAAAAAAQLTNEEEDHEYHHHRPPLLPSSSVPSYGSLRDSHLQGRFLDGPASYRDGASGELFHMKKNRKRVVRFDDSATSYQNRMDGCRADNNNKMRADPSMTNSIASWSQPIAIDSTPGERMQETAAQLKKQRDQSPSPKAAAAGTTPPSSLSAMLEKSNSPNISAASPFPEQPLQQQHDFASQDTTNDNSHNMLSASLTGLEVLKGSRFLSLQAVPEQQEPQQQEPQQPLLRSAYSYNDTHHAIGGGLVNGGHNNNSYEHVWSTSAQQQRSENQAEEHEDDDDDDRPLSPQEDNPDTVEAFDLDMDD